jgi:CheY-like chemotaxis protein
MGKRVYFVDDSPTQRAVVSRWLQAAGFEVASFPNGEEAFQAAMAIPPTMIVSDVNMPHMDGFTLCQKIKEKQPELPVLLLTRLNEPRDILRGLEAGADGFLIKTIKEPELIRRVQQLVSEPEIAHRTVAAKTFGERLRLTAGRADLFRLLFESICREIPIDGLVLLSDDGQSPPSTVLVTRSPVSPELQLWLQGEAVESLRMLKAEPIGAFPAAPKLQALAIDAASPVATWVSRQVRSRAKVPLVVDGNLCGVLGVFTFAQHALFDENIRFFFDLGADSARALRRVSVL